MDIQQGRKLIKSMYKEYLRVRNQNSYLSLVPTCESLVAHTCYKSEIETFLGKDYESFSSMQKINIFFLYTDILVTHADTILGYRLETASLDLLHSYDVELMQFSDLSSLSYMPVFTDNTLKVLEVVPFYFSRFDNNLSSIRVSEEYFNLSSRKTYSNLVLQLAKDSLVDDLHKARYLLLEQDYKGYQGTSYIKYTDDIQIGSIVPEIRVQTINNTPICLDLTNLSTYSYLSGEIKTILDTLNGVSQVTYHNISFKATTNREVVRNYIGTHYIRVHEPHDNKISLLASSLYKRYHLTRDTVDYKSFDLYDSYTSYELSDLSWLVVDFSAYDISQGTVRKDNLVSEIIRVELYQKYRYTQGTEEPQVLIYLLDNSLQPVHYLRVSDIDLISRAQIENPTYTYIVSGITTNFGLQTVEINFKGTEETPSEEEIESKSQSEFCRCFGDLVKVKGISTIHNKQIKGRTDIEIPYSIASRLHTNIVYGNYKQGYSDYESQIRKLLEFNKITYKIPSHCIKLLCMNKVASVCRNARELSLSALVDVLYDFIDLALKGEMNLVSLYNQYILGIARKKVDRLSKEYGDTLVERLYSLKGTYTETGQYYVSVNDIEFQFTKDRVLIGIFADVTSYSGETVRVSVG